jgi:hypothetical protein
MVLSAILLAACGGSQAVTVHSSVSPSAITPSATPSPSGSPRPTGLLFAVLEDHSGSQTGLPIGADTVAIVGLDGFARAKQHFAARTVPVLCDAAMLVQPEARAAAGRAFYVDASGVVRSLDPTGAVAQVTTFSLQAQQVLSFAVDPSGTQLVGARITVPKFSGGLPCQQQGQFAVDVYASTTGGNPQLGYHQTYAQETNSSNFIQAVGWDPAAAQITVNTNIGTQNGTLGQKWYGQLAHWTAQGIGSVVGGSDCRAQDAVGNSIACISNQGEGAGSVRGPDGSIQWNLPSAIYYFIRLSSDGTQAAYCNSSECGVAGKDGSHVKLPKTFGPTGWLNSSTLIGMTSPDPNGGVLGSPYGELATVSLSDVTKVNDLGFKGMFAGVVQAS